MSFHAWPDRNSRVTHWRQQQPLVAAAALHFSMLRRTLPSLMHSLWVGWHGAFLLRRISASQSHSFSLRLSSLIDLS